MRVPSAPEGHPKSLSSPSSCSQGHSSGWRSCVRAWQQQAERLPGMPGTPASGSLQCSAVAERFPSEPPRALSRCQLCSGASLRAPAGSRRSLQADVRPACEMSRLCKPSDKHRLCPLNLSVAVGAALCPGLGTRAAPQSVAADVLMLCW